MLQKQWTTLALMVVVSLYLYQGNLMAAPPKTLDVRTMADWSIVVAETILTALSVLVFRRGHWKEQQV